MRTRKVSHIKSLSPPVDYWFLTTLFLAFIFLTFLFLLIKERLFMQEMRIVLEKSKINIGSFLSLNSKLVNGHLHQSTSPFSSSSFIYLRPESYSLGEVHYENIH